MQHEIVQSFMERAVISYETVVSHVASGNEASGKWQTGMRQPAVVIKP